MMGLIVIGAYLLCLFLALVNGSADEAGRAVLEGAESAVTFSLSIAGGICLWSAVLELMEESGLTAGLAAMLRPVLNRLFPIAGQKRETLSAIAGNVSANLLGLGNAATPAGVRAAKGIAALGEQGRDELCLLMVLNTASIQILPSTIASVRGALGASAPFDITPAVWFSSIVSVSVGLLAAAVLKRLWR